MKHIKNFIGKFRISQSDEHVAIMLLLHLSPSIPPLCIFFMNITFVVIKFHIYKYPCCVAQTNLVPLSSISKYVDVCQSCICDVDNSPILLKLFFALYNIIVLSSEHVANIFPNFVFSNPHMLLPVYASYRGISHKERMVP